MRIRAWILTLGGAGLAAGLVALLVRPSAGDAESGSFPTPPSGAATRDAPHVDDEGSPVRVPTVESHSESSVDGAPVLPLEATRPRPATADAGSGPRLAGAVAREADGTPLAGARVVALARLDEARGSELALGPGVDTDAEGVFEFPDDVASAAPPGFFVEWSCPDSGGFHAQQRLALSADLGPLDALSLRLDTGWILTVHVRDEAGRPVSGAYVRSRDANGRSDTEPDALPGSGERLTPMTPARDYTPTGASGDFALRDLRWLSQPLPVVVFGEGFETNRFHVPTPPHGSWSADVDVVLKREVPGSRVPR
jgi:hypothetical protein